MPNTASIVGVIEREGILVGSISIPSAIAAETEEKTITPNDQTQVILPSTGKLISKVTVNKIPNNYGLITYNGTNITVS